METSYGYSYSSSFHPGAGFFIFISVVTVLVWAGLWRVFTKAGKPGWAAIIPIYNAIVILEIVGKPLWWIILLLVPCVNWIFGIWTINLLCKSFGKSEGFTVGTIIFPYIFIPILGFGDAKYLGPSASEAGGLRIDPSIGYKDPFNPPPPAPPTPPQQ